MIYFEDEHVRIRPMQPGDPASFTQAKRAQGWHATRDKYEMRLRDAAEGRCTALCAEYCGKPVGYINLYYRAYAPMDRTGLPEIVDFGVLEEYRKNGIGSALMDAAEALAAERADAVCLGVGLHSGYGAAQRMYVKRGYIPDGTGVWYGGKMLEPYAPCVNDDDLNLFFVKKFC